MLQREVDYRSYFSRILTLMHRIIRLIQLTVQLSWRLPPSNKLINLAILILSVKVTFVCVFWWKLSINSGHFTGVPSNRINTIAGKCLISYSCCNANCRFMDADLALSDVSTPSTKSSINLSTRSLTNKVWNVSVASDVFGSGECLSAGVLTDWLWRLEFKVGVLALSFSLFWLFTLMEFC